MQPQKQFEWNMDLINKIKIFKYVSTIGSGRTTAGSYFGMNNLE